MNPGKRVTPQKIDQKILTLLWQHAQFQSVSSSVKYYYVYLSCLFYFTNISFVYSILFFLYKNFVIFLHVVIGLQNFSMSFRQS